VQHSSKKRAAAKFLFLLDSVILKNSLKSKNVWKCNGLRTPVNPRLQFWTSRGGSGYSITSAEYSDASLVDRGGTMRKQRQKMKIRKRKADVEKRDALKKRREHRSLNNKFRREKKVRSRNGLFNCNLTSWGSSEVG
jgi:hypothetical protein